MTTTDATGHIQTRTFEYDHTIGLDDFAGRAFRNLADVGIGPDEMLYILQRGEPLHHNVSVKKCSVGEEWFGEFGQYGSNPGQMVWPAGIAVDSRQRLYVSDEWNQRISVFDTEGALLDEFGEPGSGPGQLKRPSGLALDAAENLLVVDAGNHRVQKFTPDGHFLAEFGGYGKGARPVPPALGHRPERRRGNLRHRLAQRPGAKAHRRGRVHPGLGRVRQRPRPVQPARRHCRGR